MGKRVKVKGKAGKVGINKEKSGLVPVGEYEKDADYLDAVQRNAHRPRWGWV